MPLSLRLALRYLFSLNKGSFSSFASWLAIGGLAIGITALMLTASIIRGFQDVISEKLTSLEGHGRLIHMLGQPVDSTHPTLDSLNSVYPNQFSPFIRGICMARAGQEADGMIVEGVANLPRAVDPAMPEIQRGTIAVGKSLATELNVQLGDKIFLQVFANGNSGQHSQRIKSLIISDIFHTGLQEYDKSLAFVHLDDAKDLFHFGESQYSGFILNSKTLIPTSYPFYFETWKERHGLLFEWINIQRWPAYIMFGLIALVGIVNILAAIAMIIIEKSNQIGILMAQGMPSKMVKSIFMVQGGFIGLVGSILGGLAAIGIIGVQLQFKLLKIPSEVYFMDQIPFSFDITVFTIILFSMFGLCIFASLWPTKTIASLKASDILRYE